MQRFNDIFDATTEGLYHSLLRHMPVSPLRDFNRWALSQKNPSRTEWLQIVGIPQFAKLTETLLGESVSDDQWGELVRYATLMNNYLIYETVSDNLAFGLAEQQANDDTYELRHQVLVAFNHAMIARLQGKHQHSNTIMQSIKPLAGLLSTFKYSLTHTYQQAIAQNFIASDAGKHYCIEDIEYGVWNTLVANIEACAEVVEALNGFMLQDFLREGLIRRYAAMNDLLCHTITDRDMLVRVSTDTILVMPVLTYYIVVIGEVLHPNPLLRQVVHSGVLRQILEDAALMVRLLNDIGTNLVATDSNYRPLLNDLYAKVSTSVNNISVPFSHLLLTHSQDTAFMTRIRKDLSFGEFNVSLYDLMSAPGDLMSLLMFGDNLLYFKQQYALREARLNENLRVMGAILGEKVHCALIRDFVYFHAHIYQYQFDEQAGDYATLPDPSK